MNKHTETPVLETIVMNDGTVNLSVSIHNTSATETYETLAHVRDVVTCNMIVDIVNNHDRLVAENERLRKHLETMCTLFAQTNRAATSWTPYTEAVQALKGE